MVNRFIKPISDGFEKQKTYRELNRRRNQSESGAKYVEMIAYDYAMIEDRLLSLLKHLNIVEIDNNRIIINKLIKNDFYKMYYNDKKEKHEDPQLYNIKTKISIIKKIIKYEGSNILLSEKSQILNAIDKSNNVKSSMIQLEKWLDKRNEIIHGMYNKKIEDFDGKIPIIAQEGKEISYQISKFGDLIKEILNGKK